MLNHWANENETAISSIKIVDGEPFKLEVHPKRVANNGDDDDWSARLRWVKMHGRKARKILASVN